MKRFLLVIAGIATLTAVPIFAQAIPRSYELQCSFEDGSRLVFKQHYTWDALAALIPADITTKEYTGYDVRFINKKGKKSDWLKLRSRGSKFGGGGNFGDFETAQRVCGHLTMSEDDHFCYAGNCLDKKGDWSESSISDLIFPEKFRLSETTTEQPEPIRSELKKRQLSPDVARTKSQGNFIRYERSFLDVSPQGKRKDGNLTITAVYQSESLDGGKTWSDPVITTNAKIFELGKSLDAQSFAGFPYSFNGKRFDAQKPLK